MDKPLHPAIFKKKILNLCHRCISFLDDIDTFPLEELQEVNKEIDNSSPTGNKVQILTDTIERLFALIIQEDNDHGRSLHLFSLNIVRYIDQFFKTSSAEDELQALIELHTALDGKVSITSTKELHFSALSKILRMLVTDQHCLPLVTGYESNVRLSLDSVPLIKVGPFGAETDFHLTLNAPTLDDWSEREKLAICFVVSTASSMEESHIIDEVLEGIRNSLMVLDSDDYVSIVVFDKIARVILPPYTVGVLREEDMMEEDGSYLEGGSFDASVSNSWSSHAPNSSGRPNIEAIFSEMRTSPSSNLCEGLEQAFSTVSNRTRDGRPLSNYRQVVIVISDGAITEGIRDSALIGAVVRRHCCVEPTLSSADPTATKPISVTAIRVGQLGQAEDNVMRVIASRGRGDYFWAPNSDDVVPAIVEATMGWKERMTQLLSISYIPAQDLKSFISSPNVPFKSELLNVWGYSTRPTKINTSELIARLKVKDQRSLPFYEKEDDYRSSQIKMRSVECSDLVSHEERRFLFNLSLSLQQEYNSAQKNAEIITEIEKAKKLVQIGAILLSFRYPGSEGVETTLLPLAAAFKLDTERDLDNAARKRRWLMSDPPQSMFGISKGALTLNGAPLTKEHDFEEEMKVSGNDTAEPVSIAGNDDQSQPKTDNSTEHHQRKRTNEKNKHSKSRERKQDDDLLELPDANATDEFGRNSPSLNEDGEEKMPLLAFEQPLHTRPPMVLSIERLKTAVLVQESLDSIQEALANYIVKEDQPDTISILHRTRSRVNAFAATRIVLANLIQHRITAREHFITAQRLSLDPDPINPTAREMDEERFGKKDDRVVAASGPALQAVPQFSTGKHGTISKRHDQPPEPYSSTAHSSEPEELDEAEFDHIDRLSPATLAKLAYFSQTPFTDVELFLLECNRSYSVLMMVDATISHLLNLIEAFPTAEQETRIYAALPAPTSNVEREKIREKRELDRELKVKTLNLALSFIVFINSGYALGANSYLMEHRLESTEHFSVLCPIPKQAFSQRIAEHNAQTRMRRREETARRMQMEREKEKKEVGTGGLKIVQEPPHPKDVHGKSWLHSILRTPRVKSPVQSNPSIQPDPKRTKVRRHEEEEEKTRDLYEEEKTRDLYEEENIRVVTERSARNKDRRMDGYLTQPRTAFMLAGDEPDEMDMGLDIGTDGWMRVKKKRVADVEENPSPSAPLLAPRAQRNQKRKNSSRPESPRAGFDGSLD
ncbi:hypothetical protein BLNAU_11433 [Blattamonas nauphoetae]|uniref:VWFA domain-containing protein n=1 Tax=Blattamonas nauphoetae TaxID=2049346 RepID=A0ABQ9XP90_9EUKA|nr:hypothetical protein BLNAU_11433 [Blattamonas nauphoetae]